jgi:hypothetical protein
MRKKYSRTISADELAIERMVAQAEPDELKFIRKYLESLGLRKRAEDKGEY